jgi:hypothetical protein
VNWKLIVFVALISFGAYQHFSNRPVFHGAGVLVSEQPIQERTREVEFKFNDYTIHPLQSFHIKARVLSTKHYPFGREADLAPVDLALGWGAMSDESVLNDIQISQSNRFYFWRVDNFHVPREVIETSSANMHMIPADSQIAEKLKSIKAGQLIDISGYLVEAKSADGWRWKSSLTRKDTGRGACELVYVKAISVT